MTLIICPDCDSQISLQARACPKCGCPNSHRHPVVRLSTASALGIIGGLLLVVAPSFTWVHADGRRYYADEIVGHSIDSLVMMAVPGFFIGLLGLWRRMRRLEVVWFLGAIVCALYVTYCYMCYAVLPSPIPSDAEPAIGLIIGAAGAGMQLLGAFFTLEIRKKPSPRVPQKGDR